MYTEDLYTEDLYTEDMYTEDMYTEDLYIVVFTVKQPLNRTFSTQKSPLYQTWPVVPKYLLLYKLRTVRPMLKDTPSPIYIIISLELSPLLCFLSHSQVLLYNCVKFHQYRFICSGRDVLTRYMDRTDGQTDRMIQICVGYDYYIFQQQCFTYREWNQSSGFQAYLWQFLRSFSHLVWLAV